MDRESPIASLSWNEVFEQEYRLVNVDEIVTPAPYSIPAALSHPRVAGLHAGALQTTPDFDEPLADDFWTGQPMDPETEDR